MSGAICAWCLGEIQADQFALDGGTEARRHVRSCSMVPTNRAPSRPRDIEAPRHHGRHNEGDQ